MIKDKDNEAGLPSPAPTGTARADKDNANQTSNLGSVINESVSDPKDKHFVPRVACSGCKGFIKDCRYCGQRIEILNGKPLDYHAGSYHRCKGSWSY